MVLYWYVKDTGECWEQRQYGSIPGDRSAQSPDYALEPPELPLPNPPSRVNTTVQFQEQESLDLAETQYLAVITPSEREALTRPRGASIETGEAIPARDVSASGHSKEPPSMTKFSGELLRALGEAKQFNASDYLRHLEHHVSSTEPNRATSEEGRKKRRKDRRRRRRRQHEGEQVNLRVTITRTRERRRSRRSRRRQRSPDHSPSPDPLSARPGPSKRLRSEPRRFETIPPTARRGRMRGVPRNDSRERSRTAPVTPTYHHPGEPNHNHWRPPASNEYIQRQLPPIDRIPSESEEKPIFRSSPTEMKRRSSDNSYCGPNDEDKPGSNGPLELPDNNKPRGTSVDQVEGLLDRLLALGVNAEHSNTDYYSSSPRFANSSRRDQESKVDM